jgi:hypothetical protein
MQIHPQFPLTLALSLRERKSFPPAGCGSLIGGHAAALRSILPLPGERPGVREDVNPQLNGRGQSAATQTGTTKERQ